MKRIKSSALAALSACALLAGSCAPGSRAPAELLNSTLRPSTTTGMDPAALRLALEEAGRLPQLNALIVARDGRIEAERVFDGPGIDTPVNIKSASKSVLSALVGTAVGRGEFAGLDQPVAPLLGARVPATADARVQAITVEHLLSMRAGLELTSGPNYGAWATSDDWVGYALSRPFIDSPGGAMIYSTGTSHLMSAALSRATRQSTLQLARDRLGEPLGITVPPWTTDPQGVYLGGNEMRLSPRALLRFGELYRNDGVWNGRRILPEGWVKDSWTSRGMSRWSGSHYGLGWWIGEARGRPVYFAWGHGGQMVYIVPDLKLTVVMTSDPDQRGVEGHVQALNGLLADHLVPAAERGANQAAL